MQFWVDILVCARYATVRSHIYPLVCREKICFLVLYISLGLKTLGAKKEPAVPAILLGESGGRGKALPEDQHYRVEREATPPYPRHADRVLGDD